MKDPIAPTLGSSALVRPPLADLTALEIRCSRAECKHVIHQTESILRWMRNLLDAPDWTPGLQSLWDKYRLGLDSKLAGLPNNAICESHEI